MGIAEMLMGSDVEVEQTLLDDADQILQSLDPRCVLHGYIVQGLGDIEDTNGTDQTAKFVICTNQLNRHGNKHRLTPNDDGRGMVTDAYQRNPVVLYEHGMGGINLPVGLSHDAAGKLSLDIKQTKAVATVRFSSLPHVEPIMAAVMERTLRMASVGFEALRARVMSPKKEKVPDGVMSFQGMYPGLEFCETQLFEWSITAVGADAGALRQALDKGRIHDVKIPAWLKAHWQAFADAGSVWSPGWSPADQIAQSVAAAFEPVCQRLQQLADRMSSSVPESPHQSVAERFVEQDVKRSMQLPDEEQGAATQTLDAVAQPPAQSPWVDADQIAAIVKQTMTPFVEQATERINQLSTDIARARTKATGKVD